MATGKGLLEGPPSSGVGNSACEEWTCELCEERLFLWGLAGVELSVPEKSPAKDSAGKALAWRGFPEVVQIIVRLGKMLDPEVRC